MLGLSNTQLLITIGFVAAVTGPKDLQKFARLGGIFLGRASGYIQMARGHLNGVMQQAQMQEISKEIQDLRSKIDVISHGANFSLFPTPLTRRVETDSPESTPTTNENITSVKVEEKQKVADQWTKAQKFSGSSTSVNLHAQATAFSRLSETVRGENLSLNSDQGLPPVLPVSAEMAKFLPQRKETARGSDIMLEAVLEAEVAHNAKDFFSQAGKETLSVKDLRICLQEIESLKEKWLQTLRQLVAQINETFSHNFQEMAVAGEVSLDERDTDFDQYGIHIKVKFRESGQLQVLSSHHQSGGERSVSTILYLVSLQDLTNCPFRVVDEINQGMDPVNERKMFQQLVRTASQLNSPQCFLLTPKLLPELEYSEACSILNIMNGPWIEQPSKVWSFGDSWGNLIRSSQSGQCS